MLIKKQRISIWGSTGSIGTQTLEVIRQYPDHFELITLVAHKSAEQIFEQARMFHPGKVILTGDVDSGWASRFKSIGIEYETGPESLHRSASSGAEDLIVNGLVGGVGLACTLDAIQAGVDIALANKEVLVMAGERVTRLCAEKQVRLIPVDSEHSAIYQCLQGESFSSIRRLILTASGGPFRNHSSDALKHVTVEQALAHPNWNMGAKITIDSATMMNKALEIIEARWLFQVRPEQIEVVIHPQSILHSMVEFDDGSIKAQLSVPDMRVPISYALSCPDRRELPFGSLDFTKTHLLELAPADHLRFPALRLAYHVLERGGTAPAVLNAADEVAVQAFIDGLVGFLDITECIENTLSCHKVVEDPSLEEILVADRWARETAGEFIHSIKHGLD